MGQPYGRKIFRPYNDHNPKFAQYHTHGWALLRFRGKQHLDNGSEYPSVRAKIILPLRYAIRPAFFATISPVHRIQINAQALAKQPLLPYQAAKKQSTAAIVAVL